MAPRVRDVLTSVRPCAVILLLVFVNDIVWMDGHGNKSSCQTILGSDIPSAPKNVLLLVPISHYSKSLWSWARGLLVVAASVLVLVAVA